MNNCKPPKDNGQINIAAWALMGLDLASDYGKTLDDLIVCLGAANALRTIFDMASQQQKDDEDVNACIDKLEGEITVRDALIKQKKYFEDDSIQHVG